MALMAAIGIGCWKDSSSMTFGGGIEDVEEDDSSDGGSGSEGKFIIGPFRRVCVVVNTFFRRPCLLPNRILDYRISHGHRRPLTDSSGALRTSPADEADGQTDGQTDVKRIKLGRQIQTDRTLPSSYPRWQGSYDFFGSVDVPC